MYNMSAVISPLHILMFSFSLALLTGCQPAQKNIPLKVEPQCIEQQSNCVVNTPKGDFTVLFNVDRVVTETPFEIQVQYQGSGEVAKISGYLEGRDMFMGKIPLFFVGENSNQYLAEVMLGSCAQPSMIWRLWLKVEFAGQDETGENAEQSQQEFFIDFPSSNE